MWQALHEELGSAGLEVVTVALDTDVEAAREPAAAAHETHPSLVDPAFRLVELFGITNVPFGMWIDEEGVIVRPPEPAAVPPPPGAPDLAAIIASFPEEQARVITAMSANTGDPGRYIAAVRDWVANGPASRYVLSPDEVVTRSRPRPFDAAVAAAHFELGQHLHRNGFGRDAVEHFRAAHEHDPTNWSYQRQARSLADPTWDQSYERDIFAEVDRVGTETWRPPLDL